MQGKESKLVIFDWTVSQANSASDLGFTTDDYRCNVDMSRMVEALIILLPRGVGSGALSKPRGQRYDELGESVNRKVPYPCAFMNWALSKGIVTNFDGRFPHILQRRSTGTTETPAPTDKAPTTSGWGSASSPMDKAPVVQHAVMEW